MRHTRRASQDRDTGRASAIKAPATRTKAINLLRMKTQRQAELVRQLEAIRERANSVTHMMEEDADCIDILHHFQAMRAALNKIKMELLEDYFEEWTEALVQSNEPDHCKRLLKEFLILFELPERHVSQR